MEAFAYGKLWRTTKDNWIVYEPFGELDFFLFCGPISALGTSKGRLFVRDAQHCYEIEPQEYDGVFVPIIMVIPSEQMPPLYIRHTC